MKRDFRQLIIILAAIGLFYNSINAAQKRDGKLAFRDEFSRPSGTPVDRTKWTAEIGGEGWGNKEFQYYTDSVENAFHNGDGSLVIKVSKAAAPLDLKCWYGKCLYTSARLITKNKFDQKYGRFEARIKLPRGQGIWPAFWMLGSNIDRVKWPASGEIDIMENIGREPATVYGTAHGPGYLGANGLSKGYQHPKNKAFADDFHVYAVEWKENKISWLVDGNLFHTITPESLPAGGKWVYDHPFFMILNLAVGGDWGGAPDATTVFPQEILIDYVRVYNE